MGERRGLDFKILRASHHLTDLVIADVGANLNEFFFSRIEDPRYAPLESITIQRGVAALGHIGRSQLQSFLRIFQKSMSVGGLTTFSCARKADAGLSNFGVLKDLACFRNLKVLQCFIPKLKSVGRPYSMTKVLINAKLMP